MAKKSIEKGFITKRLKIWRKKMKNRKKWEKKWWFDELEKKSDVSNEQDDLGYGYGCGYGYNRGYKNKRQNLKVILMIINKIMIINKKY